MQGLAHPQPTVAAGSVSDADWGWCAADAGLEASLGMRPVWPVGRLGLNKRSYTTSLSSDNTECTRDANISSGALQTNWYYGH